MQYSEFLTQVHKRTNLASRDETLNLTRSTLETLGERIYRSARSNLAAQLPDELKNFLMARVVPETTQQQVDRFPLKEFYQRISARAELSLPEAENGAHVVMKVLKEAVTPGQWRELITELPSEYKEILQIS